MSTVTVAATQMACTWDTDANLERATDLVRRAAGRGAQIILLQELFEAPYFCIEQKAEHLKLATPREDNPLLERFARLARELAVVLPISWFERSGNTFFNTVCIVDADGSVLGFYRKSHIPNSIGYQEKTYFTPGDTGFKVWATRYAKIGVGICWDQWFPEAARCMALQGAELLFYPTAIGSEPGVPDLDSSGHWQRTMQGHAAANIVPVIASNRIGDETATIDQGLSMNFYGHSFICDHTGAIREQADKHSESVIVSECDLGAIADYRREWGVFRDRRPELYSDICSHGSDAT